MDNRILKNIYMQMFDEDGQLLDMNSDRVTWCDEIIDDDDVRYVLAEDVQKMAEVLRCVLDDCVSVGLRPFSAGKAEEMLKEFERGNHRQPRLPIGMMFIGQGTIELVPGTPVTSNYGFVK